MDRRKSPTRPLSRYTFVGRRKQARRQNESNNYYVDRYSWHYFLVIGLILIFCGMDAFFSFRIFQFGGEEVNVLMLALMRKNIILSVLVKFIITTVCLSFLLAHKNFRLFKVVRTSTMIYFIFGVYSVLILFEVYTYNAFKKF